MTRDTAPAAPASDETLAAAPDYIVPGEWDDAEWRAAAAAPDGARTPEQSYLYAAGPREHPWGRRAFSGRLADGRHACFPTREAYEAHQAAEKVQADKAEAQADKALGVLGAALASGGKARPAKAAKADKAAPAPAQPVKPAAEPDQADAMLEAAAPHGTVAS